MSNATASHPTPEVLTAYGLGKLTAADTEVIARHLAACADCRRLVEGVPPDSFLGKVRASRPDPASVAGSGPTAGAAEAHPPQSTAAPPEGLPTELASYPKYRFVRELGRGGMGVVYLAEQTLMDRRVAIKVMNPSVLTHPDALPRFHSEVRAAAKLDHPNIVRAYDAEPVGGLHLLVMEFVEGTNLADLVQRKGPLPAALACHFIRQAALGLQHAFEQGMVHRDIKPQNLMVTPKEQIKILDFGLARLRSGSRGLTEMGAFMGTPEYVSPEQATDAHTADTRADLYSLGCTLYFLLTGRPPFLEDTVVKLVLAQIGKEPQPVHELCPDVPPELSALLKRLLAKDPAQRFQQPIEVAQALVQFIKAGAKAAAVSVAAPAPSTASPSRGTVMGADTSRIKGLGKDAAPAPEPEAPAKDGPPSPVKELADAAAVAPAAKSKKISAGVQPAPAPWYRRPPVLAGVAAAVLALGFGVWLLGGVVFKVKTKDGILVVEVNEPNPDVFVDGEKVTVLWKNGGKKAEIRVKPGMRKVEVKKDGFTVSGDTVTLTDGEQKTIVVSLDKTPPAPPPVVGVIPPLRRNDGFVPLFNGKDLTGWKRQGTNAMDWMVTDGQLVSRNRAKEKSRLNMGTLITDRTDYANFHLRAETVMSGGISPFFQIRTSSSDLKPGEKMAYRISTGGIPGTLSVFTGVGRPITLLGDVTNLHLKTGEWFRLEVIAQGPLIRVLVNGTKVVEYVDEQNPLPSGPISLSTQRNRPLQIRNLEIKELPRVDHEKPPVPAVP